IWSGTPSRLTPSSSAVSAQRSSDSVNTSFARLKLASSRASCSTVSTITRLNASCSPAGTVEKAAVRFTSLIPYLEDVRVGLRRVGADGEGDRLAQLVLGRAALPGARQVALRSVGVADREVGRQIAEVGGLGIQRALLELPRRDHPLFHYAPPNTRRPRPCRTARRRPPAPSA